MTRPGAAERRAGEIRTVISTMTVVKLVATACALLPAFDHVVSGVVGIAVALAVVTSGARWVLRRARWWAEDVTDARRAAAWRAVRASLRRERPQPARGRTDRQGGRHRR